MKTIFNLVTIAFLLSAIAFTNLNAQPPGPIQVTGSHLLDRDDYTSLTLPGGVFAALNGGPSQAGKIITVVIWANILNETGQISLNDKGNGAWTSLRIVPFGGAWIVSGNSGVGRPLIDLNGADNVTIDGFNYFLTIGNFNNSPADNNSTIRFINGASNNTIRYCRILGSSQNEVDRPGGTIFFSTDNSPVPWGNDDNIISNNFIGPAGAMPFKAIFGSGNLGFNGRNSHILIDSNKIYDFFGTGVSSTAGIIAHSGNDDWTISNNIIYQTGLRIFTTTPNSLYSGIFLGETIGVPGTFGVYYNKIGFASNLQTGTTTIRGSSNRFTGINAHVVDNTAYTRVENNLISGINQTTDSPDLFSFIGIDCFRGSHYLSDNRIGSLDASSTIVVNASATTLNTVCGIVNTSISDLVISKNQIGSITINQAAGIGTTTGFAGIYVNTIIGIPAYIDHNEIAKITNNLIGDYSMYGISSKFADATISENTVRDMSGRSNGVDVVMAGIVTGGSTGVNYIEKNDVHYLTNNSNASGSVHGLDLEFPATDNRVRQNVVYGLDVITTNWNYQIVGMLRRSGGSATIYNNMITLGYKPNGNILIFPLDLTGIGDESATASSNKYYYNTVHITGSNVLGGGSSTYCMDNESTNIREFKNNIFLNNRNNPPPAKNYAVRYAGIVPNPPGLTSDYNNLYASGANSGVLGRYNEVDRITLADWRTATGQDLSSTSRGVTFANPVLGDLRLTGASIGDANLAGTPIPGIVTDIDDDLRHAQYPYMGADEGAPFNFVIVSIPSQYSNLTSAFNAINNGTHGHGDITVRIDGSFTQTSSATLNGGVFTSLNIMPTTNAIVSGNFIGGTIILNGADNVTIDGRIGGTGSNNDLTFTNQYSAGVTITMQNGATNNVVRYCNLNLPLNGTNVNIAQSTPGTGGNNDNTIENCVLSGGQYGLYINGTPGVSGYTNDRTTIRNNKVKNFRYQGIVTGTETINNNVTQNEVFNDVAVAPLTTIAYGIYNTSVGTNNITKNYIHDITYTSSDVIIIHGIHSNPLQPTVPGTPNTSTVNVINNMIALGGNTRFSYFGIVSNPGQIPYIANIYYNSVRIFGNSDAAVIQTSMGIVEYTLITGSTYNLYNNLVRNDRTGGGTGTFHYGTVINLFSGTLNADYNTICATDPAKGVNARFGQVNYSSLRKYKDAIAKHNINNNNFNLDNSELHSSFKPAPFLSNTDLHLNFVGVGGDMNAKPFPLIAADDFYNVMRSPTFPYRGADEIAQGQLLNLTFSLQAITNPPSSIGDIIILQLINPATCAVITSSTATLPPAPGNTTVFAFGNMIPNGPQFYLRVIHRNSISLWSATPQSFASGSLTYDFTNTSGKAFGVNAMKLVGTEWSMYAGDVNESQDGIIDIADLSDIDNFAIGPYAFNAGYTSTDLNFDGVVDITDLSIADNNVRLYVYEQAPCALTNPEPMDLKDEVKSEKINSINKPTDDNKK